MRARSASRWTPNACTSRCRSWTWTSNDADAEADRDELKVHTARGAVRARGANQTEYLNNVRTHDLTFGIGPAGTGKTYLAVACAVEALQSEQVRRIVLVRPAVEAGERLGFLPGDLSQKVDPYLRPMYDALYEMMGFERVAKSIERNVIEVAPLAFMRGRSLNDSFVILDEAQNTTNEQMKMFLTRIGFGSKAVVTGDITQVDLPNSKQSGLAHGDRHSARRARHRLHHVQLPRRGAPPAGAAHRPGLRGELARRGLQAREIREPLQLDVSYAARRPWVPGRAILDLDRGGARRCGASARRSGRGALIARVGADFHWSCRCARWAVRAAAA